MASAANCMEMIKLFDCKTNKQETGNPQTLTDAIRHHKPQIYLWGTLCNAQPSLSLDPCFRFGNPSSITETSSLHNRDLMSGDGDELNYWKQMHHGLQLCSLSGINWGCAVQRGWMNVTFDVTDPFRLVLAGWMRLIRNDLFIFLPPHWKKKKKPCDYAKLQLFFAPHHDWFKNLQSDCSVWRH